MLLLGATRVRDAVTLDWQTYVMIVLYFLILLFIGWYSYKKSTDDLNEYMLGGRNIGPYVTALSAGAADMSGWMIMGLPGEVYSVGLSAAWLAIGLTVGAYINYFVVAPRLRVYTEVANDSITIPEFFNNRLSDNTNLIKIISGLIIVVFFTLYVNSGLVAGGRLFESAFGTSYHFGLILIGVIIIVYTFFGGYLAVSLTDFFQGVIMLIAMVMVPIVAMLQLSGLDTLSQAAELKPTNLDWFKGTTVIGIISFIAWGLGYFGQPHIIVRFMSVQNVKKLRTARRFGISWMAVSLFGAVLVGLTGITFVNSNDLVLEDPETIFILMGQLLFHPLIGGFLLAAILAAIMSTIASQLIVTSSALTEDFYKLIRGRDKADTNKKEFVMVGRFSVLLVAAVAMVIAWNPNSTILDLVGNAWAGFGAAFGPIVILSLYWKGLTRTGAISGMVAASITVILWIVVISPMGETGSDFWNLYEILPGFIVNLVVTVVVSLFTKKPEQNVEEELNIVKEKIRQDLAQ